MSVHVIESGQTLGRVAGKYGVTVKSILEANPAIKNPDMVQIGQKLQIPSTEGKKTSGGAAITSSAAGGSSVGASNRKSSVTEEKNDASADVTHTIRPGETLGRIATLYGIALKDLLLANPSIKNPNRVQVGQKLLIPARAGKAGQPVSGSITTGSATAPKANPITKAVPPAAAPAVAAAAATSVAATGKTGKNKDRKSPKTLAVSTRGLDFIASYESYEQNLYNDDANHCTIGYGHLVHYGPCTNLDKQRYPNGVNKSEAKAMLKKDANTMVKAVQKNVKVDLSQSEFDALVSWTFNLGEGNLRSSTMLKKLNKGDYDAVPKEMARWSRAGGKVLKGLVKRRKGEGDMFATGVYVNH